MTTRIPTKTHPINSTPIQTLISCVSVSLCCVNFFPFDGLLSAGKIHSPTIVIVVACEFIRWAINKFVFRLDASSKEYSFSGVKNANASAKRLSIVSNIKNACTLSGLLSIFTLFYALICILMGASYQKGYEETLMLSAVLTAFTILPIGLFLGPSKTLQYLFYDTFELSCHIEVAHLEMMQYNALGTLIGAWAGSVVAPLDWDRDWQAYPIPNILGALVGFIFANFHNLISSALRMAEEPVSSDKKTI